MSMESIHSHPMLRVAKLRDILVRLARSGTFLVVARKIGARLGGSVDRFHPPAPLIGVVQRAKRLIRPPPLR